MRKSILLYLLALALVLCSQLGNIRDFKGPVLLHAVTRKGKGISVERSKAYKYRDLAGGFKNAKATPFLVTVEPNDKPIHLNTHPGQEFNLIEKGSLLLEIDGKEIVLEEGDSIYFDATTPHGMKALNNEKARFLAIIL